MVSQSDREGHRGAQRTTDSVDSFPFLRWGSPQPGAVPPGRSVATLMLSGSLAPRHASGDLNLRLHLPLGLSFGGRVARLELLFITSSARLIEREVGKQMVHPQKN